MGVLSSMLSASQIKDSLTHISPMSHFYNPLNTSENLWFSDVFRVYGNVTLD